jgi:hypothetical protein
MQRIYIFFYSDLSLEILCTNGHTNYNLSLTKQKVIQITKGLYRQTMYTSETDLEIFNNFLPFNYIHTHGLWNMLEQFIFRPYNYNISREKIEHLLGYEDYYTWILYSNYTINKTNIHTHIDGEPIYICRYRPV